MKPPSFSIRMRLPSVKTLGIRDKNRGYYWISWQDSYQEINNLQDRVKKSQDSYQEFQEKTQELQEASKFPFRASVIMKPSEGSKNELIKYPKISSVKYSKSADLVRKLLSSLTIAISGLNEAKKKQ